MTFTSRSNSNEKRSAIESALLSTGLVQVAGGNRNSYYGVRGQGVEGYMVRVGIKAFRVVKRVRIGRTIEDMAVSKEKFHGQQTAEDVRCMVARLLATEWGAKKLTHPGYFCTAKLSEEARGKGWAMCEDGAACAGIPADYAAISTALPHAHKAAA